MIFKLSSITLLATLAIAATAQTTPTTNPKAPLAHHATTHKAAAAAAKPTADATTKTPPNIPAVAGIPKPLYSLRYIDTVIGTGSLAEQRKYYTVRYTGWTAEGTKFDSSFDHPGAEPIVFPYGAHQVISGWDTGFEGMHVGGKRRLFIPYQLAYGESGRPPVIPAKSDLIFDIELVGQSDAPPEPQQPPTPPTSKPGDEPTANPSTDPAAKPPTEAAPSDSAAPTTQPQNPEAQPKTPPHPESR